MLSNTGNPAYKAPEMLHMLEDENSSSYSLNDEECQGYDEMIDVWQIGVIVFECLTGVHPFYNPNIKIIVENILN